MRGYESTGPQIPGGPGVLWTPNGWAVQDAAMKKVLTRVEKSAKSSGKGNSKPGGVKGYYRSTPQDIGVLQKLIIQRDLAVSLLKAIAPMVITVPSM
jgi:hypothetical protein